VENNRLINQRLPFLLSVQNRTAVLRTIWLVITIGTVILLAASVSPRLKMLGHDIYGFAAGLEALGLSLDFFAVYFVTWELLVAGVSLLVAALIAWKRGGDWYAMLVAAALSLFGLMPPLVEGLVYVSPQWALPVGILRVLVLSTIMAVICLFPNGRFAPPWTRWLLLLWSLVALATIFIDPLAVADTAVLPNTRTLEDARWVLVGVTWFLAAIFGQVIRYQRHAAPVEKQQMKWVLFGFSLTIIFSLITSLLLISFPGLTSSPDNEAGLVVILGGVYLLTALIFPITIALSILRYRLWDVDILLNRTLLYGGLSLAVIAVYVVMVGALGTLFQSQGNFLFALLATGLIAVLFQPLRDRLQKGVNRFMFGERDDPYKVLSQLGQHLQTTDTPQATLQSLVQTIAGTLKLPYVAIELAGEEGRLNGASTGKAAAETAELPLRYHNETVGYLLASPRAPGESFTEREHQLLAGIAGQAGAVAYSVRLTTALQHSREKLILAREEERRRIRRDLHDELGPTLASQTFALDTALDFLETNPGETARLLHDLKAQNQETVAAIRQLVYKLRPPALDELGLAGALQAQAGRLNSRDDLQIHISAFPDPLPPLSAAVDVAAYRITLEAMTNVARHSGASRCEVVFQVKENGRPFLRIDVTDNGTGMPLHSRPGVGLNSMSERAEELGGAFEIRSTGSGGTQITALLPL
jgi:signal transduction histidine kinase